MSRDAYWIDVAALVLASGGGHFGVSWIVRAFYAKINRPEGNYPLLPAGFVGIVERPLYVVGFLAGRGELIAVWLGLKAVGNWKVWSEDRDVANGFLVGNGMSLGYAGLGTQCAIWAAANHWWEVQVSLALVVAATGVLRLLVLLVRPQVVKTVEGEGATPQ